MCIYCGEYQLPAVGTGEALIECKRFPATWILKGDGRGTWARCRMKANDTCGEFIDAQTGLRYEDLWEQFIKSERVRHRGEMVG